MAYTLVDSFVRASIPAVVLTIFALARRYFPAKSAREFGTAYSIEELNVRFRSRQWLFGGGMLLTGTIIALGMHFLLANLNASSGESVGGSNSQRNDKCLIGMEFRGTKPPLSCAVFRPDLRCIPNRWCAPHFHGLPWPGNIVTLGSRRPAGQNPLPTKTNNHNQSGPS